MTLELTSIIALILAVFVFIFGTTVVFVLWFRERNLPPEEKERRRQLRSGGMSKKSFRVLAIVRLAALGLLAGIVIVSWQQAKESYEEQFEPSEISQVQQGVDQETTSEPIDTSTWQTYRSDEFGFEVSYPVPYEIGHNPKYPETISLGKRTEYDVREPNIFITIMEEPTVLGFHGTWGVMLRHDSNQDVVYSENLEVNGQSFKREEWSQGPTSITAYATRSLLIYTLLIGFTGEESVQEETLLFNEILSTFRFTP